MRKRRDTVVVVEPLRTGDVATVSAVLGRLSRRTRAVFADESPEAVARVDGRRHVLVAKVGRRPVGLGRLVLDAEDPTSAEASLAIVDEWQDVRATLSRVLFDDARVAGVTRVWTAIDLAA